MTLNQCHLQPKKIQLLQVNPSRASHRQCQHHLPVVLVATQPLLERPHGIFWPAGVGVVGRRGEETQLGEMQPRVTATSWTGGRMSFRAPRQQMSVSLSARQSDRDGGALPHHLLPARTVRPRVCAPPLPPPPPVIRIRRAARHPHRLLAKADGAE